MKQTKDYLKTQFKDGETPTEADYADFIDSFVHLDNQAAVDAQIVSQLLITYDQNLKSYNNNSKIDTLGDVFNVMRNMNDGADLAAILAKINWVGLTNKPGTVPVQLPNSQYIATGIGAFDPQPRLSPLPGTQTSNPATAGLLAIAGVPPASRANVIINEIEIQRRWISIPTGGAPIEFYADIINGLLICLNPVAKLN